MGLLKGEPVVEVGGSRVGLFTGSSEPELFCAFTANLGARYTNICGGHQIKVHC